MQNQKNINSASGTMHNQSVVDNVGQSSTSKETSISKEGLQEGGGFQPQVESRLRDAMVDVVEKETQPSKEEKKPNKKIFSKMAIFFVIFFSILGILIFLFMKFRDSGSQMLLGNKGEIVWWGIQHDVSVYQPLIDRFEKENPNIKIRYEKQSTTDYQVRLLNALNSGDGPDIIEIHNTWPVMLKDKLSALPSSVMSKEEFVQSFYPIIVSNLTLDKGIVGMPLEYDALTLFINEDVFTSSLKSPPDTWDDLRSLAPQLTQKKDKNVIIQAGVAMGITKNIDHWQEIIALMLFQNGTNPGKPTGPLALAVFNYYKEFAGMGVWSSSLPNSTSAFSRGELSMYFGPTRRASEIVRGNPNLKFRTVKLPQLPKNKPDDPNYSYATYWLHSVSEKSKIKEGAWTFLKFLSREDSLKEINENISKFETFKRVYPRPNMNTDKVQDPILGSIIYFAYDSRSFFLADNTFDGLNGINTQVNNLYDTIINNKISEKTLLNKSQELSQILGKYGVRIR